MIGLERLETLLLKLEKGKIHSSPPSTCAKVALYCEVSHFSYLLLFTAVGTTLCVATKRFLPSRFRGRIESLGKFKTSWMDSCRFVSKCRDAKVTHCRQLTDLEWCVKCVRNSCGKDSSAENHMTVGWNLCRTSVRLKFCLPPTILVWILVVLAGDDEDEQSLWIFTSTPHGSTEFDWLVWG